MTKKKFKTLQISCDGGAATGKSTGAEMISRKYNLKFLSSGLLYRYASFLILNHKPKNYNKETVTVKSNEIDTSVYLCPIESWSVGSVVSE